MNPQAILHYLGVSDYKNDRDEYRMNCFFCGEVKYNLQINFVKSLWHCWVCNEGGQLVSLISQTQNISYDRARKLFNLQEIDVVSEAERLLDEVDELEGKATRFHYRVYIRPVLRNEITNAWKQRGILFITTQEYLLGVDEKTNRLVMPVLDENDICVGLIKRTMVGYDAVPKYLYTKGFNKRKAIYPLQHIQYDSDNIVLTEGPIDALVLRQLGYNAVAIMGLSVSDWQLEFITRNWDNVILAFDNDQAAWDMVPKIKELFEDKCSVYMLDYIGNDPGEIEGMNHINGIIPVV